MSAEVVDMWDGVPEFLAARPVGSAAAAGGTPAPVAVLPSWLSDDWDTPSEPVLPALLAVEGGMPLIYAGESHLIAGRGGSGKSWICYAAALEAARDGGGALIVDYESNRATVGARLRALGASREDAARVAHWRVTGALTAALGAVMRDWVAANGVTLVVIDSVSPACQAAGLDDEKNPQYAAWHGAVVAPLEIARVTTLLIDHVGHADGDGGGRSQRPRGASAKLDRISGAAYVFTVRDGEHWTRERDGRGQLSTLKDREGNRAAGEVAAIVEAEVADSGASVRMAFRSPAAAGVVSADGGFRPTALMARVSDFLADRGEDDLPSVSQVTEQVGGRAAYLRRAVEVLVAEGSAEIVAGPRNARLVRLVRPYDDGNPF